MSNCSSILAWRIPRTEEPGGLQSMGSQRVGHDCACTQTHAHYFKTLTYTHTPLTHCHPPSHASSLALPLTRAGFNPFPTLLTGLQIQQRTSLKATRKPQPQELQECKYPENTSRQGLPVSSEQSRGLSHFTFQAGGRRPHWSREPQSF